MQLGNILSWLGLNKWLIGAVGAAGLAALLSIGWLNLQLSWKDNTILKQQQTITTQSQKIDTLNMLDKLNKKANDALNDRVESSQDELQDLINRTEAINAKGPEDDGPVAPVLDDVVRAPGDRKP